MPFINTKTNVSVSAEQERELVKELGRAIAIIPGKSEPVLMLNLQDNQRMAFRGTADGKMAMVEVGLLGKAPAKSLNDFTAECCNILNRILRAHAVIFDKRIYNLSIIVKGRMRSSLRKNFRAVFEYIIARFLAYRKRTVGVGELYMVQGG